MASWLDQLQHQQEGHAYDIKTRRKCSIMLNFIPLSFTFFIILVNPALPTSSLAPNAAPLVASSPAVAPAPVSAPLMAPALAVAPLIAPAPISQAAQAPVAAPVTAPVVAPALAVAPLMAPTLVVAQLVTSSAPSAPSAPRTPKQNPKRAVPDSANAPLPDAAPVKKPRKERESQAETARRLQEAAAAIEEKKKQQAEASGQRFGRRW